MFVSLYVVVTMSYMLMLNARQTYAIIIFSVFSLHTLIFLVFLKCSVLTVTKDCPLDF